MLLPQRHASLVTTVLIPLASLGLLLPPFLRYGLQETLPAVVAFIVICEPSSAASARAMPRSTFTSDRSPSCSGHVRSASSHDRRYAAAILLFDIMKIAIDFDIL